MKNPWMSGTLLLWSVSTPLLAATYKPTRFDDPLPGACLPTDCSLREAVMAASAAPDADRIALSSGTYLLQRMGAAHDSSDDTGALKIRGSVRIGGQGSAATTVRWKPLNNLHAVFEFGTLSNGPTADVVEIQGQTISHGRAACIAFGRDPQSPRDRLALQDVVVENCTYASAPGGAITVSHADLDLRQTILRGNSANSGGAMRLLGEVNVTSEALEISGNQGHGGGALFLYGGFDTPTSVIWVDAGGSRFSGNHATGQGGAIHVIGNAVLDLSTLPGGKPLLLEANVSDGVGGAIYFGEVFDPQPRSRLVRVRIRDNTATIGGGIYASRNMVLMDSELRGNVATTGNGGGLMLATASAGSEGLRELVRVSLHDNRAPLGGGGAMAFGCTDVSASNVSVDANLAAAGRGQAFEGRGRISITHNTILGVAGSSPTLYKPADASCAGRLWQVQNSLIAGQCASDSAAELVSLGGNQLGASAGNCPALPGSDQRQGSDAVFQLTWANHGGPNTFNVLGWPAASAPPQRNVVVGSCIPTDVRGLARTDGQCDAGAFEAQ